MYLPICVLSRVGNIYDVFINMRTISNKTPVYVTPMIVLFTNACCSTQYTRDVDLYITRYLVYRDGEDELNRTGCFMYFFPFFAESNAAF